MTDTQQSTLTLTQLGWRPFYQQQIDQEQWEYPVARVIAQYRNRLKLLSEAGQMWLDISPNMPAITVGDWLLLTPERQFDRLYNEVFGDLDQRLTRILRAVGTATREAGILPSSFNYTAADDQGTGFIRFGIRFSVDAEYNQIRRMLAALQSSPEFLVVTNLSLTGDEDPVSRELAISVNISTFLAEADAGQLRRLTGGIARAAEISDG